MAGMFYSLQEAAEKLNITEKQVEELVKDGKLREFRDGANVLFKVDEVEALMSDTGFAELEETPAASEQGTGTDEISLVPEATEDTVGAAGDELIDSDTFADVEGIDSLGETDSQARVTDDVAAETKGTAEGESLEEIEEDVNLDTFGSGSGLLDLSLQADDTSLGGILDEIYTAESGEETSEGSALEMAAEAEPIVPEEEGLAVPEPIPEFSAMTQAYAEPAPDTLSNAFGTMLFLPLLAIVYTAIVAVAGFTGVMPAVLEKIQGINAPYGVHVIWYAMAVTAVVAMLIAGVGFMLGSRGAKAGKKAKVKKQKKAKRKTQLTANAKSS